MENHPQTSAAVVQGAGNVTFNNSSLIVQAVAVTENRKRNIVKENEEAKKSRNADHHQLSEFIWIFQDKPLGKRENVFEGEMRSDVCNPRLAAIKYIPFNKKNVKEAKILEKLTPHPHVVAILHSNTVPGPMKYLYIAMERCHTQTLQDFIIDRKKQGIPFDFSLVFKYTEQLIDGMRHIHKNTIIHRDLKPENILFSFDMQSIKISDFGLSKELKSGRSVTNQSTLRVGTDGYRAPETYNKNVISLKADIFSLALALYFLWSYGLHPFGNDPDLWNFNIKNNQNRDLKSMLIPQISAAIALLERMLNFEPTLRPTIEEVFQDPCVSELTVPMTLGSNMDTRMTNPSMNLMPNNDQAPDVLIQPNSVPLWSGNIEWKEKRRVPSGTAERTTHRLQCEIIVRPNQNYDALDVTSWPNTLGMQLVPHDVVPYRNLTALIRNNISVSLKITPIEQMTHLAITMRNKWMGVVKPQATPNPQIENRFMVVLYSQKNNHFVGFLPRDAATFISTIKQAIHMHQNQPRQPNPDGPQLVQPLQNVGASQSPADNRMPTHTVSNQNQFIVQNSLNASPVMRPMNQMPEQHNWSLANSNMQVRQSIQMQPGVSTQSRLGLSPTAERMPGNGQMVNTQSMMTPQLQKQSNLGAQMQPGGGGNQQYIYHNNINPRQLTPSRPAINQSDPDMVRQQQFQQLEGIRMQQQRQQQQSQQFNPINQMPVPHNAGEEQLRSLLQQAGSSMAQGMNQQRPAMRPPSQAMTHMLQGSVRPFISNQQMRQPMQSNRMIGMQQQRFGSGDM